jgi:hypothetical protein
MTVAAALFMDHAAAGPYAGPGDIVASWFYWGGLRAFSLASIGSNAIKLRRDSDNTTQSFVTVAGGGLDIASITTFKGAANLFVDTLYDQSGSGNDFVQTTTLSRQPTFTLNFLGSKPAMGSTSAANTILTKAIGVNGSKGQPFSFTAVAQRTANFTSYQETICDNGNNCQLRWENAANTIGMNAITALDATASDSVWHGFIGSANGASSNMQVDSTSTPGNAGTVATGGPMNLFAYGGGGFVMDGNAMEFGGCNSAISVANAAAINAQAKAFYGY